MFVVYFEGQIRTIIINIKLIIDNYFHRNLLILIQLHLYINILCSLLDY